MRKAFILGTGADTGGAAIRTVEAFRVAGWQHPRLGVQAIKEPFSEPSPPQPPVSHWQVRSMVTSLNYIQYDQDVPYAPLQLTQMYDEADVVQLNNTLAGHDKYDNMQGKPTVLMHHGLHEGHFRQSIQEIVEHCAQIGAVQIGSTVNLELYSAPGTRGTPNGISWAPIPYDLRKLREMRRGLYETSPNVRIGHAPTDRAVKSTETVIKAVSNLRKRGFPVELVLIEGKTHAETLKIKAKSVDIYVDQLKLGYGCNAIESWGMGIPVIAGFSAYPEWREHAVSRYGCDGPGGLPFMEANEETLEENLEVLVGPNGEWFREQWTEVGHHHVKRWHSAEAGVRIYSEVYDRAVQRRTIPSSRLRRQSGFATAERRAMLKKLRLEREEAALQDHLRAAAARKA